jgi:hypothetical protein
MRAACSSSAAAKTLAPPRLPALLALVALLAQPRGLHAESARVSADASSSGAAEDFAEEIKGIMKSTSTTAHAILKGSMAIAVIGGLFLGVFQNVISFVYFFELGFGVGVV